MRHVLVVLPMLAVAACSGGSSADDAASKTDYLRKAEAICTQANADQKALKSPTSAQELSPYVDAIVRIADRSTTALLKLTPPTRDKADLDKHVFDPLHGQLVQLRDYADKVRAASKAKDQIALVKLLSDPPNKTAADLEWMRTYGFRQCVDAADTAS
ncbi:MAG: hypothetical protein ABR549_04250 [Mycobacteriales bacterium]